MSLGKKSDISVIKRDGSQMPLDIEKLHKVVFWSTEGLSGVSASAVEIRSQIQFYNGITSTNIQETLIKAAADLITEETPNYQYVAGRLINYHLRKEVYGQYEPIKFLDHVKKVINAGYYDRDILTWYTDEELTTIGNYINHERDYEIVYVGMEQFRGKYLIKNRVTGKIFETPQMAYMPL